MPEVEITEGVARHLSVDGIEVDVFPHDRFVMLVEHCDKTIRNVGFRRRGQMFKHYAKELAHAVTMENLNDVDRPLHVTKVICLSFADNGTATFDFLPVMHPVEGERIDCAKEHT